MLDDDLGRLTVRRLWPWPWHRLLARCLASSLDRQLADGVRPEANAVLAARAMVLTSARYRRGLAGSLRRMLAASLSPQTRPRVMAASRSAPRVSRMSRSAGTGSPGPHPSWTGWPVPSPRSARSPPLTARCAWFDFFRPDYEWIAHFYPSGQPDSDYLRNRIARLTFDLRTGQAQTGT